MTFDWNGEDGRVLIKFIHGQRSNQLNDSDDEDSETSSSESTDDEFEIEDQDLEDCNFLCWTSDRPWTQITTASRRMADVDFGKIPIVIVNSIQRVKNTKIFEEGVQVKNHTLTWEEYFKLEGKFNQTHYHNSRWTFDWRGPAAECWCRHKLPTKKHEYPQCYDDLLVWINVKLHTPDNLSAIIPESPIKDWWLEVEHQRESNKIPPTEERFFTRAEALRKLKLEDRVAKCNHCKYFVDSLNISQARDGNESGKIYCDDCFGDQRLNLPACSQCGIRDEARYFLGVTWGYNDIKYFCDYTEQCVYAFNHGGWRKNNGTIKKLRSDGNLLNVYQQCNEIGKAILARYITIYDEEEELEYIEYEGSEEASAQEIFMAIYQQLSPSRRKQLAQLEYINVKLCNECLIPCDSDVCEDCVQSEQAEEPPVKNVIKLEIIKEEDEDDSGYDSIDDILMEYYNTTEENKNEEKEELEEKSANLMIKVYNDNDKGKMPERAHETDAGFDLRYPGEEAILVQPYRTIMIDLFLAIEVPVGTVCQLMS
jgi:hypothetical protein